MSNPNSPHDTPYDPSDPERAALAGDVAPDALALTGLAEVLSRDGGIITHTGYAEGASAAPTGIVNYTGRFEAMLAKFDAKVADSLHDYDARIARADADFMNRIAGLPATTGPVGESQGFSMGVEAATAEPDTRPKPPTPDSTARQPVKLFPGDPRFVPGFSRIKRKAPAVVPNIPVSPVRVEATAEKPQATPAGDATPAASASVKTSSPYELTDPSGNPLPFELTSQQRLAVDIRKVQERGAKDLALRLERARLDNDHDSLERYQTEVNRMVHDSNNPGEAEHILRSAGLSPEEQKQPAASQERPAITIDLTGATVHGNVIHGDKIEVHRGNRVDTTYIPSATSPNSGGSSESAPTSSSTSSSEKAAPSAPKDTAAPKQSSSSGSSDGQ